MSDILQIILRNKILYAANMAVFEFVTYVIGLSQLSGAVSELAVLVERAGSVLSEVSAKLSLVLLLESVELALVAVEVVIVALLSEVTKDLARRIVEVLLATVLVLGGFFTRGSILTSILARESSNSGSGSTLSELLALAQVNTVLTGLLLCRSLRVRRLLGCRGSCISRVSYLSCSG